MVNRKLYLDGTKGEKRKEFEDGDKVWILKKDGNGREAGEVLGRKGELSYSVQLNGKLQRKHAD